MAAYMTWIEWLRRIRVLQDLKWVATARRAYINSDWNFASATNKHTWIWKKNMSITEDTESLFRGPATKREGEGKVYLINNYLIPMCK